MINFITSRKLAQPKLEFLPGPPSKRRLGVWGGARGSCKPNAFWRSKRSQNHFRPGSGKALRNGGSRAGAWMPLLRVSSFGVFWKVPGSGLAKDPEEVRHRIFPNLENRVPLLTGAQFSLSHPRPEVACFGSVLGPCRRPPGVFSSFLRVLFRDSFLEAHNRPSRRPAGPHIGFEKGASPEMVGEEVFAQNGARTPARREALKSSLRRCF